MPSLEPLLFLLFKWLGLHHSLKGSDKSHPSSKRKVFKPRAQAVSNANRQGLAKEDAMIFLSDNTIR